MAVRHYTYNLTSTPIELTGIFDTESNRRGMTIVFNTDKTSNDTTMIGASTVTATDFGLHLDADVQFVLAGEFTFKDRFYARAKTTSAILHVLIVGG